ncbi:MAG: orotidine-5'-phosphate decarboxylase [Planctomycetota bacterium]
MTSDATFIERLIEAQGQKESLVIVGLDPHLDLLPPDLVARAREETDSALAAAISACRTFCLEVLEAVAGACVAVKPQIAFFEQLGSGGIAVFEEVVARAQSMGLAVIGDVKRGDIGSTAAAYARAWLGGTMLGNDPLPGPRLDALTVNPYLGSDGIRPFVERAAAGGQGLFVLVRTSNPSSGELQDLVCGEDGEALFERVGRLVSEWGRDLIGPSGLSDVGAVVGATYPESMATLRRALPTVPFLVPGFGAQGGGSESIAAALNPDGRGAWVNASRSILFAYRDRPGVDWRDAAKISAESMREELWRIRSQQQRT